MNKNKIALRNHKKSGFTLVELAIVIVIIGLLVGGVLQGQELITQAKLRAQIKQFQEYDAAVAIFKDKYKYLPGDMPANEATKHGFNSIGDGNGIINDGGSQTSSSGWNEAMYFFPDLQLAKLISARLNLSGAGAYAVGGSYPDAKIAEGGIAAVGVNGVLHYFLGPMLKSASNHAFYNNSLTPMLTPELAYQIDLKIDDGIPSTGNSKVPILSLTSANCFAPDTINFNSCLGANAQVYNVTNSNPMCRLIVKSIVN